VVNYNYGEGLKAEVMFIKFL